MHVLSPAFLPRGSSRRTGSEPVTKPLLLLLDDEAVILAPTAAYFRRLGFVVDTAREAEEAEALVEHRCYDLAVLDLLVTEYGRAEGLEVLREIKRHEEGTKVILLSASVSPEVEAEARALGADAVLHKPQRLPDLAHIAFALLSSDRQ